MDTDGLRKGLERERNKLTRQKVAMNATENMIALLEKQIAELEKKK